ncbi:HD domain-containing phosphohydrolase [Glaciecola sp. KUL10]|uniref:HD domain-containing phosphohydrolase n=1 Tax=Glaciecola sp. (strain KUL10) TaxID=2161813 RepID=UPI000D78A748|nr:HD domain-containing phosphohydrolase [Glaciecola sp. KUL10]GBL04837.1 HD-GYP domain-like protein [Glaciecola sp. KUL10]
MNNSHYLDRLAEVNKQHSVVIKEPILNAKGALVAKEGTHLCKETARKIAKHKLIKPIDQSVSIAYSLTKQRLIDAYTTRLKSKNLLDESIKNGSYDLAMSLLPLINRYAMIEEKLTIFASVYPDRFGFAITASVLAAHIAKEYGLSEEKVGNVFLANVLSDVGLLHLDPKIVENESTLNNEARKMYQGHVAISMHFADMVPGLPRIVKRAILEHHERADGLGYPFGKTIDELCIEGQIICIVDELTKFYYSIQNKGNFSLKVLFAVLRIPTSAHDIGVHNAMLRVLAKGELPYKPAFNLEKLKQVVKDSFEKLARLSLWFDMFSNIYEQHREKLLDTSRFKPWALLYQLQNNIDETGVLSETQKTWLLGINKNLTMENAQDVEEFYLLLDEVEKQCYFVLNKMVEQKDVISDLFGGPELPEVYYTGLLSILTSNQEPG